MPQFHSDAADEAGEGLDPFTASYIEAMYFTDTGEDDQPPSESALSSTARQRCINDCATFQAQHFNLLAEYYSVEEQYDETQAGHDFWLTRNGHGTGFWDRGLPGDLGERLTAACKAFGEVSTCGERDGALSNDWVLYVS